jgi:uncharacterized protein (DUF2236 family)
MTGLLPRLRDMGLDPAPPPDGRPGDPGMFGPGSEAWHVGRERVMLAVGPAALLMQLGHPLVAAGVADHSDFRRAPFERLRTTLDSALALSFGDTDQAHRALARVGAAHLKVSGKLGRRSGRFAAGTSYDAWDPHLAMWVHGTLIWTAMEGYATLVAPLPLGCRERYYQEAKRLARLFGVTDEIMPEDYGGFLSYVGRVISEDVAVGPIARELAWSVLNPPIPIALSLAGAGTRLLTAGLLPARLRQDFLLPWDAGRRTLFRALTASVRSTVNALPGRVRYWPHYFSALRRNNQTPEVHIHHGL